MDKLINKFVDQLQEAAEISEKSIVNKSITSINKVFISGMGGSGIAGMFASKIMNLSGSVPVITSNSYDIPNWIDSNTLAIVSSYSGNTEETISTFNKLMQKGTKIICITAGGKLLEQAIKNKLDFINLPGDWPAPRACFGFSFVAQLSVLKKLNLLNLDLSKEIKDSIELLKSETENIKIESKEIAVRLINKLTFIYSNSSLEPVSIRFKQQLNENSKALAHHSVFPEMNHNELVGFRDIYDNLAVVIYKSSLYSERVNARIDLSKEIMIKSVGTMIEIEAKGENLLQQMFYLVHLSDWISLYLALEKGVDSMEIINIDYLKSQLAKI